jgi:hypothetical protein
MHRYKLSDQHRGPPKLKREASERRRLNAFGGDKDGVDGLASTNESEIGLVEVIWPYEAKMRSRGVVSESATVMSMRDASAPTTHSTPRTRELLADRTRQARAEVGRV